MSAKRKASQPQLRTCHVPVSNYDLIVYAGQSGLPPEDGNLAGKELAELTISGNCTELNESGVFKIKFFPTGTQIQSPVYVPGQGEVQVNLEMDVCQLAGVMAALQVKSALAYYFESAGAAGTVLPFAQITTQDAD